MSEADSAIVRLEGISKRFGSVLAVDQLNIDINKGEFVTFLGPSGCGKSTTLRILGGFEKPDSGRVILDSEDVTKLPPNKRKVNMVFQDYALFPHMNVQQNIDFGLELKGLTNAQIKLRREEVMAYLELAEFGTRYPDQLSGGQRQRVALARALAPDPALLLLDEPLGALDAKLRAQVQQELKAIQRRTNTTFFFVTHDQDEALTMSDRIVVMNNGRVEQDGTPEELYLHPTNRFVAEFIGDTNLLTGVFRATNNGEAAIEWCGQQIGAHAGLAQVAPGTEVTCSIRFENLKCQTERPDMENTAEAQIVSNVFKGSRKAVTVAVKGCENTLLTLYVDTDVNAGNEGDSVWIGWNSKHLSLLQQ